MVRTRVGYAGGTTPDPTYHDLGDHSEVIELDYDPSVIDYRQLLDVFWRSHDATRPAFSRQYRSAIFYRGEGQRREAEESLSEMEARVGRVATSVEPLRGFFRAEDYHQKYRLRSRPDLVDALVAQLGGDREMVDSTAAARLNGWLGGYGTQEDISKWLPRMAERSAR